MCNIVFLDIDGVLNNRFSHGSCENRYDAKHIDILNIVLFKTAAKIVLSSTWRKQFDTIDKITDKFSKMGIIGEVIGLTPVLPKLGKWQGEYTGRERGEEIQDWLNNTKHVVDNFVIVDDEDDMCHLIDSLVLIDGDIGLTVEDGKKIVKKLGKNW